MHFQLPFLVLLVANAAALPYFSVSTFHNRTNPTLRKLTQIKQNIKRDVMMMELPANSGMPCIELFRNLCIGIAVCNPVTVTKGGKGTGSGGNPNQPGDVCVGIAVCNPVTVNA